MTRVMGEATTLAAATHTYRQLVPYGIDGKLFWIHEGWNLDSFQLFFGFFVWFICACV